VDGLRRSLMSLALAVILMVLAAVPAHATLPGHNGRIAFQSPRTGDLEIYSMNPDGSDVRRLTSSPGDDRVPAWSADGRKIAFASDRAGAREIFVMNVDGSGVAQLTHNGEYSFSPAWSPDGTRIAFYAIRRNTGFRPQIYVVDADGTGEVNISNNTGEDYDPSWSPDGSRIVFWSRRSSDGDIWSMNADGSDQTRLTSGLGDDVFPDWSPDGHLITFTSTRPGYGEYAVWVMGPDGSGLRRIATGFQARWSPDGSKFVFERYQDTSTDLFTMNADGNEIANVTSSPGGDDGPSWQPVPNRPPDCSAVHATPESLWPPNQKLVAVSLAGATDPDGDAVTLAVTGVTADEPIAGDFVLGPAANEVKLRAERDPHGDGRVYSLEFEAADGRGGKCTGLATVTVPRNR
jgi:dipeptidyl aminopeptidase/acylaminoacyl peptidase